VHEANDEKYKCDICYKTFKAKQVLYQHKWSIHKIGPVHCDICDAPYSSKRYLKRHIQRNHKINVEEKFKCDICDQEFDTHDIMEKHTINAHLKLSDEDLCNLQTDERY
jgi:hypothetical protein